MVDTRTTALFGSVLFRWPDQLGLRDFSHEHSASIPNFSDRSIYRHLSRELAFEAVATLPLLGEPTPGMIDAFSRYLGWELRDSPEPVVNLCTTFNVRREGASHVYAVGGVMRMGVASSGEGDAMVE